MMRFLCCAVWLVACGKPDPNAETCDHYAKLMVECAKESPSPALGSTAQNLCMKGLSGKHEEMFGARYRAMIECTRTTTTCDAFDRCIHEESP